MLVSVMNVRSCEASTTWNRCVPLIVATARHSISILLAQPVEIPVGRDPIPDSTDSPSMSLPPCWCPQIRGVSS